MDKGKKHIWIIWEAFQIIMTGVIGSWVLYVTETEMPQVDGAYDLHLYGGIAITCLTASGLAAVTKPALEGRKFYFWVATIASFILVAHELFQVFDPVHKVEIVDIMAQELGMLLALFGLLVLHLRVPTLKGE